VTLSSLTFEETVNPWNKAKQNGERTKNEGWSERVMEEEERKKMNKCMLKKTICISCVSALPLALIPVS
jgi:hypothetical protein